MPQTECGSFLRRHFESALTPKARAMLRGLIRHPSVRQRGFAFDEPSVLVGEDADKRVLRFTRSAVELAARAARLALADSGISERAIRTLVVNTCTGYLCPGLTGYLIEALNLERAISAFDLVGAGCAGAVPNLELGRSLLAQQGGPALCVAVEICSCTFQMGDDPSLIVSNALFADGAAAAVLTSDAPGLRLLGARSLFAPEHREAIRFVYKGGQLHNQLARELPTLAADAAGRVVADLLSRHGLRRSDKIGRAHV
jgi:predicted naringenin-chalcone synthase